MPGKPVVCTVTAQHDFPFISTTHPTRDGMVNKLETLRPLRREAMPARTDGRGPTCEPAAREGGRRQAPPSSRSSPRRIWADGAPTRGGIRGRPRDQAPVVGPQFLIFLGRKPGTMGRNLGGGPMARAPDARSRAVVGGSGWMAAALLRCGFWARGVQVSVRCGQRGGGFVGALHGGPAPKATSPSSARCDSDSRQDLSMQTGATHEGINRPNRRFRREKGKDDKHR